MTTKNRTIRLDDDNFKWLGDLPGRTTNDAITALRRQIGGPSTDAKIDELLELTRGLPGPLDIEDIVQRVTSGNPTQPTSAGLSDSVVDHRPKNALCKHCGSRFVGVKSATICSDCKGSGHTLTPAECPVCNEARAL